MSPVSVDGNVEIDRGNVEINRYLISESDFCRGENSANRRPS